jgi:hypothetical protein
MLKHTALSLFIGAIAFGAAAKVQADVSRRTDLHGRYFMVWGYRARPMLRAISST